MLVSVSRSVVWSSGDKLYYGHIIQTDHNMQIVSHNENVNGSHTVMYNWQWMCSIISCKMYPDFRDFKLRVGGSTRDACRKTDEKQR